MNLEQIKSLPDGEPVFVQGFKAGWPTNAADNLTTDDLKRMAEALERIESILANTSGFWVSPGTAKKLYDIAQQALEDRK